MDIGTNDRRTHCCGTFKVDSKSHINNWLALITIGFTLLASQVAAIDLLTFDATLKHYERGGVRYNQGYTTIQFLFTGLDDSGTWAPFLDLRGQGLDSLKLGANVGVGIRYLTESLSLWGCNLYYDARQGSHHGFTRMGHTYQEIGIGFEYLSRGFDLRINAYLPFGPKYLKFQQITFNDGQGITPIYHTRRESTMRALDAEIGTCVGRWPLTLDEDWTLYGALGAYYLSPTKGVHATGGKARIRADLARYFFAELRGYYDGVQKGILQFGLGVTFPLYPRSSEKSRACRELCPFSCQWLTLREMLSQPVERAEIMPLRTER